jgi:hypothetical protein
MLQFLAVVHQYKSDDNQWQKKGSTELNKT